MKESGIKISEKETSWKEWGQTSAKRYSQLALDSKPDAQRVVYGLIGRNGAGEQHWLKSSLAHRWLFLHARSEWTSRTETCWFWRLKLPVALNHLNTSKPTLLLRSSRSKSDQGHWNQLDLDTLAKKFRSFSLGMKQRLGVAITDYRQTYLF